jgi:hypothetical protein
MVAALRARNAPFRNPGWIMSPQPVRDGRQPADGVGRQLRLDGEGGLADGQPGATAAPTSSGLSAVTTWRLPSWPRSTTPHSCTVPRRLHDHVRRTITVAGGSGVASACIQLILLL